MKAYQRISGASLLCLALALGATACGTSAGAKAASPSATSASAPAAAAQPSAIDPLAGKSVAEILAMTRSDMLNLTSVHFVGNGLSSGQSMSWDFREAPGRGCYGTLNMHDGTTSIIVDGNKAWTKMDDAALKSAGLGDSLATLHGKYIATSATKSSAIIGMCDLSKHLGQSMTDSSGLTKGPVATVDGTVEMQLTTTDGSVITISDTDHPRLLSVKNTGADTGTLTFSDFDQPITLTPPAASQILTVPGM